MNRPPEQDIADYLFVSGYAPGTIIAYLEGLANAGKFEFAEGDYVDYAVCERPDGTRYGTDGACNPETGKPVSPSTAEGTSSGAKPKGQAKPKEEKPDKSVEELKMEKMKQTAAKQGSDPTNNRKVLIDGNAYGWAMKGGKWTMVPWGSVAGIKKVGPKQAPARRGGRRGGRRGSGNNDGYIQGLRIALDKQSNDAGREAIMELIREAGGTV
jgi:hypothetical protein